MMEAIISKILVLRNGLSHGRLPIGFPDTFLWLLPKIEKKNISLDDDIVRHKNSRVIKICQRVIDLSKSDRFVQDLSKSDRFFLLGVPKYLATIPFYSLYV